MEIQRSESGWQRTVHCYAQLVLECSEERSALGQLQQWRMLMESVKEHVVKVDGEVFNLV